MKKVVVVIGHERFRDEEFFIPKEIIEEIGVRVVVASSSLEMATGKMGGSYKPDILVEDINVRDYDAVVFVGGPGAKIYFNDPFAHKVAKETMVLHKPLAAICCAPVILANAGILEGKKATAFVDDVPHIKEKGAIIVNEDVVIDGNLITGNGPKAATIFGKAIIAALG